MVRNEEYSMSDLRLHSSVIQTVLFWVVSYRVVSIYQRFRGTYRLHLKGLYRVKLRS
jgi:hypothetical protein